MPSSFVSNGHLGLRGGRMIWRYAEREGLIEGDYRWLWCSDRLAGLSCRSKSGTQVTIWLTPRRVGPQAWRLLQQRYRIDRGGSV